MHYAPSNARKRMQFCPRNRIDLELQRIVLIGRVVFASLTLGMLVAPIALAVLLFVAVDYEYAAAQESGPPPAGSAITRREWGEKLSFRDGRAGEPCGRNFDL